MTRQYPNNYMLNRIAGVVFDFMVIASITSINVVDIWNNNIWIAFLIISTVGGLITMVYVRVMAKRVYHQYELEGFSVMYGMLTGTASTGIALLREVDPYYKTPAATDIVTGTTTAILFGFPILLLAGFAPNGITQAFITLGILIVLFLGFMYIPLEKASQKNIIHQNTFPMI
jgi:glutamate:Na+ symporter, ESS family